MTPAQLRAYSAVVRSGSVRAAAEQLGMSDAGVSMHVAALRKELGDTLFTKTRAGLAFTPGGLRLASRAVEILGLQQQTAIEVTEAAHGRRMLRIAACSTFAEHAAPGLIELFSARAADLSVELSVHPTSRFVDLITSRAVDIAIGPASESCTGPADSVSVLPFLKYQLLAVTTPDGRLGRGTQPRDQDWLLGPSAGSVGGEIAALLRALAVPEARQRIFQSDAAALEEVRRIGAEHNSVLHLNPCFGWLGQRSGTAIRSRRSRMPMTSTRSRGSSTTVPIPRRSSRSGQTVRATSLNSSAVANQTVTT